MPRFERKAIFARLEEMKRALIPIIGGGAGTGLSARCEEAGGIDLIVIYNSGRHRMVGRGSLAGMLAYGNANEIVGEMVHEVLAVVKKTPTLAGVNGTDPFCLFDPFLDELKRLGFAGVQNFPTVGLIDGLFRASLEKTGMSYALEVEMIALAHAKDMLTTPYVFYAEDAQAMARAGADIIVYHLGLTLGGAIGARTARALHDCPALVDEWAEAALAINEDVIVLAQGGPVAEPEDAEYILRTTKHCHGCYGASSTERLPTERAMTEQDQEIQGHRLRVNRRKGRKYHGRGNLRLTHPVAGRGGDRRRHRGLSAALALSPLDQGDRVRADGVRRRKGRGQRRRLRHSGAARRHSGQHDRNAHRDRPPRSAGAYHQESHARRCAGRILRQGRLFA
jgi:predicted TIM-barrel enzyme